MPSASPQPDASPPVRRPSPADVGPEDLGPGDDKRTWRRALRAVRRERATTRDRVDDGGRLAEAVSALWADQGQPPCVAAYLSLPTEPPTEALLHRLVSAGARVLLPEMLDDRDLDWRAVTAAPLDGTVEVGPRLGLHTVGQAGLVVVPALAVDGEGTRLGQGGGSYDRALVRRSPDALVVALLHDGELVPAGRLPHEPHDARVHVVVTPGAAPVRCTGAPED
ncbi:MAG TPA: 5-formyltetrahydrofolate cyclo-ligase [Segeticoccus sp.]|nr:5-formyltetrahydrofolate cyclo-ligase [Segeticoccus sp.]